MEGNDFLTLDHGGSKKCTQKEQMTLSSLTGYLIPAGKIEEPPVTCPRQQMASWTALLKGGGESESELPYQPTRNKEMNAFMFRWDMQNQTKPNRTNQNQNKTLVEWESGTRTRRQPI